MTRLSPLERRALDAFVAAVRAKLGDRVVRLVLFGSRARGEGRDDSDLDVAIVVRDLVRAERGEIIDVAHDVGLEHRLVLSAFVVDARRLDDTLSIARAIADEGIAL